MKPSTTNFLHSESCTALSFCPHPVSGFRSSVFVSYYSYDEQGTRTRKVVVKGNIREERYYLDGYEIFRIYENGGLVLERHSTNLADDEKVFARIDEGGHEGLVTRYQYDNHLGSACLELDENADIISYEEYHPFGTTSYRAGRRDTEVALKRYKYCGKERDEETGLYYYGMRYYAAWLCRWISVDPLAKKAPSWSPYNYCFNNPIRYTDPNGEWPFPGVRFLFFKGGIGAGVTFALSAYQQSGIAKDRHGTTHFVMSRINYLTNQNMQDGSKDPNVYVGVEASISAGIEYNWNASSFVETLSNMPVSISASAKSIIGFEVGVSENSFSFSVGIGAGGGITVGSMSVDFSVSLSKSEAATVNSMSDVITESWGVMNTEPTYTNGHISGFTGTVYTKDTQGSIINTGIHVISGYNLSEDGKTATSNNIWISKEYNESMKD